MLVAALLWRPKRRPWPTSALLLLPQLRIFFRGWGRPGDTGIVAEEDGRALMEPMHERARSDGLRRVSLSVDAVNPAKRLYEALGYRDLVERDGDDRMIVEL
jgi:GNAT superfamily N-acetyltransferase